MNACHRVFECAEAKERLALDPVPFVIDRNAKRIPVNDSAKACRIDLCVGDKRSDAEEEKQSV